MSDLANSLEPKDSTPPDDQATEATEAPKEVEAPQDPPQEEKKHTMVPHAALHEERKRRQETEAQLRAIQQHQQVMEQRYQQLYQAIQPQPKVPDKNEQPLEYLEHELQQAKQKLGQFEHWQYQNAAMAQQQHQANQLAQWARNEASQFAAEKPDFKTAYEHILKLKSNEFQAMGVHPQHLPAAMANFELGLFYQSAQSGRNPGEAIYELARATGYGQQAQAEQKVQVINKGMQASKTLGNGGVSGGMPTPEQIADMSEDEFAAFKAELGKKGKRLSDVM